MEKWTKSTFYSATVNEVSNGKMDIFGNFFSKIYFCVLVHFSFVPFKCTGSLLGETVREIYFQGILYIKNLLWAHFKTSEQRTVIGTLAVDDTFIRQMAERCRRLMGGLLHLV